MKLSVRHALGATAMICGCHEPDPSSVQRVTAPSRSHQTPEETFLFRLGSYRVGSLASWVTDPAQAGRVTRKPEGYFSQGQRLDAYGWLDPLFFSDDRLFLAKGYQREKVIGEAEDIRRRDQLPSPTKDDCGRILGLASAPNPSADQLAAILYALDADARGDARHHHHGLRHGQA